MKLAGRRLLSVLTFASIAVMARAAPISFNTALPVHKGGLLVREQIIWMRLHDDPSSLDREMDVVAVPSVLVYGATSKFALMGVVPYLDKELDVGSLGVTRQSSGFGDVTTIARSEIFERSRRGQTTRGALFAGLEWPTGEDDESDVFGRLPPGVQLGSGSYDPIVGTVWTGQWLSLQLDGDLAYQRNTEENDFKFGDVLQQNLSVQYRLWPRALASAGVPAYLYGVLEANNIYRAKDEMDGVKDDDSGGYQLFLTPGLQWVTKRLVLEVAAQLPAIRQLHGDALETNFQLTGGFRLWF